MNVQVRINDDLLKCIREKCSVRSMRIEDYLLELADNDAVPIRKARSNFLLPSGAPVEKIEASTDNHRTKLRPAQIQRLLHLRSEGVSTADIAVRFGLSRNRITSLFADYDKREHTPSAVQPADGRKRGRAFRVAEASPHA